MNLKETVYKISRRPALVPVGRSFYFLCERLLGHTFKGFPEIRSAYVAGSMAEGDIVPGLSDIDCVITIDDLGAREEYKLMTELERKVRYRMPPFGKDKIGIHVFAYSSAEWSLLSGLFLGKKVGMPRALFRRVETPPVYEPGRRV
ncbi:MAG: nucleotidyltransferase domain-containing protein, partial [Candidatus Dadabacteria bacterium]|nr:nucleotidyltransferase domain-containing protein [Candidatus Dadabacteria bacterium]